MAPEFHEKRATLDNKVDVWSIGCLAYFVFQGNPAFKAKNITQLRREVKHG